ncbi:MAG: hypothetical protein IAE90_07305 [Ignavibacteria bacterium]|nr:hypothetical protein [Ignavibacteria bacterium]
MTTKLTNRQIAKDLRKSEATISLILTGKYKGSPKLINLVHTYAGSKREEVKQIFSSIKFYAMCKIVVEKGSSRDAQNIGEVKHFAALCLMKFEEINSDISEYDRIADSETKDILKSFNVRSKLPEELFLDDRFEDLCNVASRKAVTTKNLAFYHGISLMDISMYASACLEASHTTRVRTKLINPNKFKSKKK